MRGRHTESSWTHKRVVSRERLNTSELNIDEPPVRPVTSKESGRPSWRRSLPHVLVACISSFLFGYHLGVVNETLESISLELGFSGNTIAEGLVVSTCLGGAFIGSLFSGWVVDRVGRRRGFQLCALPMIIGASISALAKGIWVMLLGRFSVGIGMGIGPPVAALYVAEVSPTYVRGAFGSSTQIATCLGLVAALFFGLPAKKYLGWWRLCFWVSTVPSAALALCVEFCAESPHWLFKFSLLSLHYEPEVSGVFNTERKEYEAEYEFGKLFGVMHVKSAIAELSKSDRGDDYDSIKLSEILFGRHSKVVFTGSTLFALQQLSGINAVFYFSSIVFKSYGVPSALGNTCVGIANLSGSIIAMILMDKLGRKVLLVGSFAGMAVSLGVQVIAASSYASGSFYLPIGGMLMFVVAFALGAGPVPSLLMSEILPGKIRETAMAICIAVHWVVNFFVGLLFLPLLEQIGAQVLYTVFGTFCVVAVFFVKKHVIETKGKSLQEIEIAFLPQDVHLRALECGTLDQNQH